MVSVKFSESNPPTREHINFSCQLVGNIAPSLSNLVEWLQQNTSYDVAEESVALVRSKVGFQL